MEEFEVGDFVGYSSDALKKAKVPSDDKSWKTTGYIKAIDGKFADIQWPKFSQLLTRVPLADLELRYRPVEVGSGNDSR